MCQYQCCQIEISQIVLGLMKCEKRNSIQNFKTIKPYVSFHLCGCIFVRGRQAEWLVKFLYVRRCMCSRVYFDYVVRSTVINSWYGSVFGSLWLSFAPMIITQFCSINYIYYIDVHQFWCACVLSCCFLIIIRQPYNFPVVHIAHCHYIIPIQVCVCIGKLLLYVPLYTTRINSFCLSHTHSVCDSNVAAYHVIQQPLSILD